MALSIRILTNVVNVNTFDYSLGHSMFAGEAQDVYLQLIDTSKDPSSLGYKPSGRRYMPASGSTLTVDLDSLDDTKEIDDRVATQPFSLDPSIWKFSLLTTDKIVGTVNIRFKLIESGVTKCGRLEAGLLISSSIC